MVRNGMGTGTGERSAAGTREVWSSHRGRRLLYVNSDPCDA